MNAASAASPQPERPDPAGDPEAAPPTRRGRRVAWIAGVCAATIVAAYLAIVLPQPQPVASGPAIKLAVAPTATATAPATATASAPATARSTPTPTARAKPTQFPANKKTYDLKALPQVNVLALLPALPLDDDAFGAFEGEVARALGNGAPVFSDPTGQPVGYLAREYQHDGTTVPIVEKQKFWVKVLLAGRQAVPSQGTSAQVAGWLRTQDIQTTRTTAEVEVSISARTIDIVRAGVPQRVATDFGWGRAETPTPRGRTFIMTSAVVPGYEYTRGHPIVYFGVQSPTMDGFGGANVAVTAFHYHDDRSGAISNGCIRVGSAAITRLAELPLGTPVVIRP
jgi:hypothetical protein